MKNSIQPISNKDRSVSESDIVVLEGICILQERCQVFLPGDMRRSYQSSEGTRPSTFLDDIVKASNSSEDNNNTLVSFLKGMATEIVAQASSTTAKRHSVLSIKRLAIRRMFELHPLEAAPGTRYKSKRKEARSELKRLASFVFDPFIDEESHSDANAMQLIATNLELLCKYASSEHIDLFLRWLVDFTAFSNESQCSAMAASSFSTTSAPRIQLLLKPSFYELRPIRDRLFAVLTHMLDTSLRAAFSTATFKDGTVLYAGGDNNTSWVKDLSAGSVVRKLFKKNKTFSMSKYFGLTVPNESLQHPQLNTAQNIIQLVLGLPRGYIQHDVDCTKFLQLVLEFDVLSLSALHDDSLSSTTSAAQSFVTTARSALETLSVTHAACVTSLCAPEKILNWLLISANITCNSCNTGVHATLPLWISSTFAIVENMMCQSFVQNATKVEEQVAFLNITATTRNLLDVAIATQDESAVYINGVNCLTVSVLNGARVGRKKSNKSQSSNQVNTLCQELMERANQLLVSEQARQTWWKSPLHVPGLLRLGQLLLMACPSTGAPPLFKNCLVAEQMLELLSLSVSGLLEHPSPSKTIVQTSLSLVHFMSYFCTLKQDEAVLVRCLRLALALGTVIEADAKQVDVASFSTTMTTFSATPVGQVFVMYVISSSPQRIAHALDLLFTDMAIVPSHTKFAPQAIVALRALSDLLSNIKRIEFWHIVSKVSSKMLNAVSSIQSNSNGFNGGGAGAGAGAGGGSEFNSEFNGVRTGNNTIATSVVRAASLSVLLSMLRQPRFVTMGTRELTFCLQYLTCWSDASMDETAVNGLATLTYDTLTSMLEYRAHAVYSCASAFVLVARSMLRVAQRQSNVNTAMMLVRYISRIFEEMAKETHRNALRHYCLYLLHEALTGILQYGWPMHVKEDFLHGLFCLLDACTEYQSQMLFSGLNEGGRALLRRLRTQHQQQHMWTK